MSYEEWKKKKEQERATAPVSKNQTGKKKKNITRESAAPKSESQQETGDEAWKRRKAAGLTGGSQKKQSAEEQPETGYEAWKRRNRSKRQAEAAEKVNQWLNESRKMSDSYGKRYGSGSGRYRSDSDQWLTETTGNRDRLRSQAMDIGKYLEENRHILGDDFIAEVTDIMRSNRKFQSSVVDQAQREKDYYSRWENEAAYNADMKKWQEYEAKRNFDTQSGAAEVDAMKADLEEADQIRRQLNAFSVADPESVPERRVEELTNRLKELEGKYGSFEELNRIYSQKNSYLNEAQRIQEGERLSGVAQLDSEYYDPDMRFLHKAQEDVEDVQYRYINDEAYRRQYQQMLGGAYDNLQEAGLEHLTEDEKRIYNYYYAKHGKEQAQEYLNSIRETLNYRRAEEMYRGVEDNTLLEMAFGIEAGIDQWQSGMSSLINNTEGKYIAPSARQMASGMVREDLGEKGKFAQGAYDVVRLLKSKNLTSSNKVSNKVQLRTPASIHGNGMMPGLSEQYKAN